MPTGRILNNVPTARIRNVDSPVGRVSEKNFTTKTSITVGTPIGLLLALTYAATFNVQAIGIAPIARIRNTD